MVCLGNHSEHSHFGFLFFLVSKICVSVSAPCSLLSYLVSVCCLLATTKRVWSGCWMLLLPCRDSCEVWMRTIGMDGYWWISSMMMELISFISCIIYH